MNKKLENNNLENKSIKKKFFINKWFKFEQKKATWKKELLGGLTTFLSLIYIIQVETMFIGHDSGIQSYDGHPVKGIFLVTCLVLGLGTILMGLSTNAPIAACPAMGLNAMFQASVAKASGMNYEGAMLATIFSSILLLIICWTPLLMMILKSIPKELSKIMSIAIGFFIAYSGLNSMGWIGTVTDASQNASHMAAEMSNLKMFWPKILLGMIGLFGMILFMFKKIPGGVAIMMAFGLIVAVILANTFDTKLIKDNFSGSKYTGWNYGDGFNFIQNIKGTFTYSFTESTVWKAPMLYMAAILFTMISLFDIASSAKAIVNEMGITEDVENQLVVKKTMKTFSFVYAGAAFVGSSPAVTALESNAGIGQGAKTGIAAIFSGILFLLTISVYPIMKLVPDCIVGSASVYIGILMVLNLKDVNWKEIQNPITALIMILFMVVTFNITNGLAAGIIMYTFVCLCTKKAKAISPTLWVVSILFIGYFIAYAFIQ